MDISTSCTPGIARSGFPLSFCHLKLKPKKRPRLSLRPHVNASSCGWDGRGFLQLYQRESCYLDCRVLFARRHDSSRTCSVHTRASSLLAHGSRPAVKLHVDTSDTGLGPSVSKPDADVQQSVQPTVEAAQQIPEAEDDESVGEREKLRRQRIGLANKGKVPWNKGRQHSPGECSCKFLITSPTWIQLSSCRGTLQYTAVTHYYITLIKAVGQKHASV